LQKKLGPTELEAWKAQQKSEMEADIKQMEADAAQAAEEEVLRAQVNYRGSFAAAAAAAAACRVQLHSLDSLPHVEPSMQRRAVPSFRLGDPDQRLKATSTRTSQIHSFITCFELP